MLFETADAEYLIKQFASNRVVLFTGAGFSRGAQNRRGKLFPLSSDLVKELWTYLRYPGDPDTDLPTLYAAALSAPGGHINLKHFLEERLLVRDYPDYYRVIARVLWNRIYTTNVDDLIESVYHSAPGVQRLSAVSFPHGEPRDRDQSLRELQYVKLNGSLPGAPSELTFSERDYAERSVDYDPLYDQFVRDYGTLPVVFIGTELHEPLFWQHIVRRERRGHGGENRPRAFLISPRISPPKRSVLRDYFVTPIEGTAENFCEWLVSVSDRLPSQRQVLSQLAPDLARLYEVPQKYDRVALRSLTAFFKSFHRVERHNVAKQDRSMYLLGASPRWEDLWRELDAPRAVNDTVRAMISQAQTDCADPILVAITGSAGSGKSTVLRRVALQLVDSGNTVYLTNSEQLPSSGEVLEAVSAHASPLMLFFDNGEIALRGIREYTAAFSERDVCPIFVVAVRTNVFDRQKENIEGKCRIIEIPIPNLTREDIVGIIQVLRENALLGYLQGLSQEKRIHEFEVRAKRQILVAMREATSGRGFDEIIADEYHELINDETRALYLSVALATDEGFRITIQQFVACAKVSPGEALGILRRNLRDIVLLSGPTESDLLVRHRLIAQHILSVVADRTLLADAYERLLRTLAHDVVKARHSDRNFRLYRALINHANIFDRFTRNVDAARSIYEALAPFFEKEYHFWLQYGSLELEYGNLDLADNYLSQAASLAPANNLVLCAQGHLLMKQAIAAKSLSQAVELRREGFELLDGQILDYGPKSEYPFHILAGQAFRWAQRWEKDETTLKREYETLIEILKRGISSHPKSRRLRDLQKRIQTAYLNLATGKGDAKPHERRKRWPRRSKRPDRPA